MFKSVNIKSRNNSQGFSLMELVVYMALLIIVVVFLFQFLLSVLGSESRGNAREEVISNATIAINAIDFEIRHSESIYDPASDFISDPGQLSILSKKDLVAGEVDAYVDIFINSAGPLNIANIQDLSTNSSKINSAKASALPIPKYAASKTQRSISEV